MEPPAAAVSPANSRFLAGTGPATWRSVGLQTLRSSHAASVALLSAVAVAGAGCLSHEYRLSSAELTRLAASPPETRANKLRAVQKLGIRRAPALDPTAPPPPPAWGQMPPPEYGPDPYYAGHDQVHVAVGADVYIPVGGSSRGHRPYPSGPVKAPPASARPAPGGGQPVAARPAGSWRGPGKAPPAASGGGGGGGGVLPVGGGGGGGDDDLIVYAVVAIAVASLAAVGLAVTEGMRFDGDVAASPGQLVYLQSPGGAERPVPIANLTPADLAGVDSGILRDDEGWGLLQLARAPLDRQGFAFKVDVGATQADLDRDLLSGLASHIQLGYFPHQRLGILVGVSLAVGQGGTERRFARHALALETQVFPLSWKRLHLGGAAHVGSGVIRQASGDVDGALTAGAGGLLEIALTTRLALHARADFSASRVTSDRWSSARSVSFGLAVY